MIDIVEMLQHWHAGRPKSVVASSLGIDAKTDAEVRRSGGGGRPRFRWTGVEPGGLGRASAGLVPRTGDARARSRCGRPSTPTGSAPAAMPAARPRSPRCWRPTPWLPPLRGLRVSPPRPTPRPSPCSARR